MRYVVNRKPWVFFVQAGVHAALAIAFLIIEITDADRPWYGWLVAAVMILFAVNPLMLGLSALRRSTGRSGPR